jgi:Ca-activated chloride channel family protein
MKLGMPLALALLGLAIPLAALMLLEHKRRLARRAKLFESRLFDALAPGSAPGRALLRRGLQIGAVCLVVLALAGPKCGVETEILPRRGLDVVFAIDVSSSMRARDVLPDRLERAKAEIGLALDELGENRIGIIAFSGTAYVQCPLTTDVEAARSFLRALDPGSVPHQGTNLAAAFEVARNLFESEREADEDSIEAGRVLVVVTDGEDHEGGVEAPARQLQEMGVRTLVLGVGDTLGEPIPVQGADGRTLGYKKDRAGETIMTRLEPKTLQAVAEAAGGRFVDAKATGDLGMSELKALVAALAKREFEARVRRHDIDRARWPLGLALGLLFLSAALPARRRES